ncbi:MAG: TPR end-of-group domain-containing protein [Pyrinomonadaceae bacterium]
MGLIDPFLLPDGFSHTWTGGSAVIGAVYFRFGNDTEGFEAGLLSALFNISLAGITDAQLGAIAGVYATLGDKDEAFRILEKAVAERHMLAALKEDPPFENLHSDPRWKALLRRTNFPPE